MKTSEKPDYFELILDQTFICGICEFATEHQLQIFRRDFYHPPFVVFSYRLIKSKFTCARGAEGITANALMGFKIALLAERLAFDSMRERGLTFNQSNCLFFFVFVFVSC